MSVIKNYNNFLNEIIIGGNKDYSFSTNIKNLDVDINYIEYWDEFKKLSVSKENNSIYEKDFIIEWSILIETKEYGVKNIFLDIKNVRGEFIVEEWSEDEDDIYHNMSFDSNEADFEIVSEVEIKNSIYPNNIEIDFKNKKIILT